MRRLSWLLWSALLLAVPAEFVAARAGEPCGCGYPTASCCHPLHHRCRKCCGTTSASDSSRSKNDRLEARGLNPPTGVYYPWVPATFAVMPAMVFGGNTTRSIDEQSRGVNDSPMDRITQIESDLSEIRRSISRMEKLHDQQLTLIEKLQDRVKKIEDNSKPK